MADRRDSDSGRALVTSLIGVLIGIAVPAALVLIAVPGATDGAMRSFSAAAAPIVRPLHDAALRVDRWIERRLR